MTCTDLLFDSDRREAGVHAEPHTARPTAILAFDFFPILVAPQIVSSTIMSVFRGRSIERPFFFGYAQKTESLTNCAIDAADVLPFK